MWFTSTIFGEFVFDDEYDKIKQAPGRIFDDDDFYNGFIYKISNVLNNILYIGVTCNALKTW